MDDEWYGHKILRPHHIFDVSKDVSEPVAHDIPPCVGG